ncbi:MAG: FHA domain-containing protein [Nitrospinota bacterium]
MAKIILKLDGKILREHEITDNISIGREKGDIILKNPAVSAKHARLNKERGAYVLEDLDSTNGTFVNQGRISTQQLHHGDIINIGKYELEFINMTEASSDSDLFMMDEGGMTVMIDTTKILKDDKPSDRQTQPQKKSAEKTEARLIIIPKSPADSGRMTVHRLKKETTLMGSGDNVDIRIKGFTVANVAATVRRGEDGYYIGFMGGMSKLRVNGNKVEGEVKLKSKDRVEIGSYLFEFLE